MKLTINIETIENVDLLHIIFKVDFEIDFDNNVNWFLIIVSVGCPLYLDFMD